MKWGCISLSLLRFPFSPLLLGTLLPGSHYPESLDQPRRRCCMSTYCVPSAAELGSRLARSTCSIGWQVTWGGLHFLEAMREDLDLSFASRLS